MSATQPSSDFINDQPRSYCDESPRAVTEDQLRMFARTAENAAASSQPESEQTHELTPVESIRRYGAAVMLLRADYNLGV